MKKIGIIVTYFGEWPPIFPIFLESVKRNSSVDFYFITDNNGEELAGIRNAALVNISLEELSALFSDKLGLHIRIPRPYKICDFRPMFGHIFEDYIREYDFWGHCDVDLVFGDIRSFISENVLNSYDKVLARGNFSIYRNNNIINRLYQTRLPESDWKDVALSDKSFSFDEWPGIYRIFKHKNIPVFMDEIILDISPLRHHLRRTIDDNVYPQVFYYQQGRIFRFRAGDREPEEFCLIHLQKRQLKRPDFDVSIQDRIYFTPTGFLPSNKCINSFNAMKCINAKSYFGDVAILSRRAKKFLLKLAGRWLALG